MALNTDGASLAPVTQEVISLQATLTIGTIGNSAHGKSTLVKAISGIHPGRYSSERQRCMTIKLGYANAKIYKCEDGSCVGPGCYRSYGSEKEDSFPCDRERCSGTCNLVRHVSFVDCPGIDILLSTMLTGTSVMDAAMLLIGVNEACPGRQTKEHLGAVEMSNIKEILVLQNKIDLVSHTQAQEHLTQMHDFVRGTIADSAPVVQVSTHYKRNMDKVCEYIANIPEPVRDLTSEPRLIVIRSFNVNKPGCVVDDLKGGVVGGKLLKGVLKVDMEIELRPGIVKKDKGGNLTCSPIKSPVVSLRSEQTELLFAVPGGLIGVGTKIDPTLCQSDRLVGQVLGAVNSLPDIYSQLTVSVLLLRRLLGAHVEEGKRAAKVLKLMKGEILMLNIGSLSTGGRVLAVKDNYAKILLTNPVCAEIGEKFAISRRVDKHWRLIGWGQIRQGVKANLVEVT